MTVEDQNFEMRAGDTKNIYITVSDEDNGGFMDLQGVTINWLLYDPNTKDILITKTTTSGVVINNPTTSGIFYVSLLPVDTVDIKPANWYIHEAEVTDALGNVVTVTVGFVRIKESKA